MTFSDGFFKKLSTFTGLLALAAIFALSLFVANIEIKDLDFWLHLGMGRHIVQNGFQVPDVDILSCTVAGRPWVNHEWFFQVIVYWITQVAGFDGIATMQVLLVAVTLLLLLFLGYNSDKQLATIFIFMVVSFVYQERFTHRPDLFSLLFFVSYIFLLANYIQYRWSVWVFFLFQVLWTNIHGFFFFGPVFIFLSLLAEYLKRHVRLPFEWNTVGRLSEQEYKNLRFVFLAVLAACLINPLTFEGAWYPVRILTSIHGESSVFFNKIIELKSPLGEGPIFSFDTYPFYKLLIIITAATFIFNRRRLDIGVLIFWVAFLLFSVKAVRNLAFFAFASYFAVLINIMNIKGEDIVPIEVTDKRFLYLVSIVLKIFLLMATLHYWIGISGDGYFDYDRYDRKSEFGGVSLRIQPIKAADFLVENNIKGNFFNDFNSGAYLIGRCFPDIRVFIDGRTEVYGPKFFKRYMRMYEGADKKIFKEALAHYKITGILFNSVQHAIPVPILNLIQKDPDWKPVYFGSDGIIYLKNIPAYQHVISRHEIDFHSWIPPALDLYRIGLRRVSAFPFVRRAQTLTAMGFYGAAKRELAEALKLNPEDFMIYNILGKIAAKEKDFVWAFENYRLAAMFSPQDLKVRLNLGRIIFDLKKYDLAVEEYKNIIQRWPNDPRAYFHLARVFLFVHEDQQAKKMIQAGMKIKEDSFIDIVFLGDILTKQKKWDMALEIYSLALPLKGRQELIYYKLAKVYMEKEDWSRARAAVKEGLALAPDNDKLQERLKEIEAKERAGAL